MKVSGIILAAGSSRRLGLDKTQIIHQGLTLVDLMRSKLRRAGIDDIVVVGRPQDTWATVINPRHNEGLSSTIRVALESLHDPSSAVLFFTVDQWQLPVEHIVNLLDGLNHASAVGTLYESYKFQEIGNSDLISGDDSLIGLKRGVPAGFHPVHFQALMGLSGDAGARRILDQIDDAKWFCCPEASVDLDTPEDLEAMHSFQESDQARCKHQVHISHEMGLSRNQSTLIPNGENMRDGASCLLPEETNKKLKAESMTSQQSRDLPIFFQNHPLSSGLYSGSVHGSVTKPCAEK